MDNQEQIEDQLPEEPLPAMMDESQWKVGINPRAGSYLLIMTVCFGLTVVVTRGFLELTGYPQIGNATFHIAHALWGGLLLVIAVWMLLVSAHRWHFYAGAVAGGVGVGLFVDEIGKFITRSLDYFFPLAAPLIYVGFVASVLIYVYFRQQNASNPRADMYRVLEDLQHSLSTQLTMPEQEMMLRRLENAMAQSAQPDLQQLAQALYSYVGSTTMQVRPFQPGLLDRVTTWWAGVEQKLLPFRRLRRLIVLTILVSGVIALTRIGVLALILVDPQALEEMLVNLTLTTPITGSISANSYIIMLLLDGIGSLLVGLAAALFLIRRDLRGIQFASLELILSLTVTNILGFYFAQFAMVATSLVQFGMLMVLMYYRRRYLNITLTG